MIGDGSRLARRRMKVRATLVMVVVLATLGAGAMTSTAAASTARQRVQHRLSAVLNQMEALQIPGFVVGVSGGKVGTFERAVGFANLQTQRRMTLDTHFRVGSVTKTFTATVILRLVEQGKLHLNDRLSRWEPRVPEANRITIRMLLNMTSGIWDEGGSGPNGAVSSLSAFWVEWCNLRPTPKFCQHYFRPQKIVDLAIQDSKNITHGPAYQPGTWYYSDTNYVILGIIAQRVTGKPFGELLKRYIFDPLHLKQTSFPTRSLAMPRPAADPYQMSVTNGVFTGYAPQMESSPSGFFSAGAIISTMHDLQIWACALASGRLLTPAMQRVRLQLVNTGITFGPLANTVSTIGFPATYGLGIADAAGMLGHNGQVPGYNAEMWYLPSVHGTVVELFNAITLCESTPKVTDILADTSFVSLAETAFGHAVHPYGLQTPFICAKPGVGSPKSGLPPLH
jgi:D-alanyl-D-alanine carboxypeptidase